MKWCRYCEKFLSKDSFTVRRASKDGLGYKCNSCQAEYNSKKYAANPEPAKQRAKKWAAEHSARRKEIAEKSATKHRRDKNKKARERARLMRSTFPEFYRMQARISAHKRRGVGEMPPLEAVLLILHVARSKCSYCGKPCKKLTLDHFSPVTDNGTNDWWNFIPCCHSCNSSKSDGIGEDWLFECHGIQGLANALSYMCALRKAIKKLFPSLYRQFTNKWISDQESEQ